MTANPARTDPSDSPTPNPRRRLRRARRAATAVALTALAAGALSGAAELKRGSGEPDTAAAALAAADARRTPGEVDLSDRGSTTSRSLTTASRGPVDPAKAALVRRATRSGGQVARSAKIDPVRAAAATGDPKAIARAMLGRFGFGSDQFSCLESLWEKESGWNPHASNPSSGAYGIPQSLPGSKMASAGADWQTNPATQIEWGLGYIRATYGSPCSAWGHSEASGWY